jgi:hypothetical protein
MNNPVGVDKSEFLQQLQALDAAKLSNFFSGMNAYELTAVIIFLVFTIAFFVWVGYLVIRR